MDKNLNPSVSNFLDSLDHPFREEIDFLRSIILDPEIGIEENIKWNGPNYSIQNKDRITMRIHPPKKQVQLILHQGAKKQEQPTSRLIEHPSKLLVWKENDRAIVTFKSRSEIEDQKAELTQIIKEWIKAST